MPRSREVEICARCGYYKFVGWLCSKCALDCKPIRQH